MAEETVRTPVDMLKDFFAKLPKDDRWWTLQMLVHHVESASKLFKTVEEATAWLSEYLDKADHPVQQFGRVIHLIAILDFEFSPQAVSRFAARATHMTQSNKDFIVSEGKRMLQDTIPRLTEIVSAWQDVRMHELDEASLWVYRDMQDYRATQEIGKHIGYLG